MTVKISPVYYDIACGGAISTLSPIMSSTNPVKIAESVANTTQADELINNNTIQVSAPLSGEIDHKVDDISEN